MSFDIFHNLLKKEAYVHYYDALQLIERCREKKILILGRDLIYINEEGVNPSEILDFSKNRDIDVACDSSIQIIKGFSDKEKYLYIPVLDI